MGNFMYLFPDQALRDQGLVVIQQRGLAPAILGRSREGFPVRVTGVQPNTADALLETMKKQVSPDTKMRHE